jgi:hypothetical protein
MNKVTWYWIGLIVGLVVAAFGVGLANILSPIVMVFVYLLLTHYYNNLNKILAVVISIVVGFILPLPVFTLLFWLGF